MATTLNLNNLDMKKPIYMIGIGGISMSALAEILQKEGFSVIGSDFKESAMTQHLEEVGITVHIGHKAENIGDVSAVIYTAAIREDNPELMQARKLSVPVVERAVLLGEIMKRYGAAIAVSGTHGKTTTTSMLSQVLLSANLDPTILVGGIMPAIGSNLRLGDSPYLVTEACEYSGSFLQFFPKISLILNVEEDHLDYFKDLSDIIACFRAFAEKTPDDGLLIVNADDENAMAAVDGVNKPCLTFSAKDESADFAATNISFKDNGCATFTVLKKGAPFMEASLTVPGMHNVLNALSTICAADFLGVAPEDIQKGFNDFTGACRRFEAKGEFRGAKVIDDYAHHPTEIKTTLKTARTAAGENKVFCVFQPHTYTRAHMLRAEFSESFADCDGVILVDIYAAREKDTGLIHAREIAEDINAVSHNAIYAGSFEEAEAMLSARAAAGDYLITMGAGDVYKIGENLLAHK